MFTGFGRSGVALVPSGHGLASAAAMTTLRLLATGRLIRAVDVRLVRHQLLLCSASTSTG
ncbi:MULTISPECIES: hypothetical protein [Nocardia]|uniref:hypothetical protein n=1 Tax=Nocardia TaxID=1817 RepID=UPI000D695969|nr:MULTISPECIES: hypothetical protein [Nocardia]